MTLVLGNDGRGVTGVPRRRGRATATGAATAPQRRRRKAGTASGLGCID